MGVRSGARGFLRAALFLGSLCAATTGHTANPWPQIAFTSSVPVQQDSARTTHQPLELRAGFAARGMAQRAQALPALQASATKAMEAPTAIPARDAQQVQAGVAQRVRVRDYAAADRGCLDRITRNVYGGRDYLPRIIDGLVHSREDHPLCLHDQLEGKVVALGNVQSMNPHETWLQAVRVDEDFQGQGLGRLMTAALVSKTRQLGARWALTSTSADNAPMRRIFDKLGFELYGSATVWFGGTLQKAHGEEFLRRSGLGEAMGRDAEAAAGEFTRCASVQEAEKVMQQVVQEARDKGTELRPHVAGEYRVHSLAQPLMREAISNGTAWVRATPGRACVAVAWESPELSGHLFLGLACSTADAVQGAVLRASREVERPFSIAFPVVEAANALGAAVQGASRALLFRLDLAEPESGG